MTSKSYMFPVHSNDSIAQPRSFSVDEFSDFQSAPTSIPPAANPMTTKSFGLTFDSPVHSVSTKSSTIGNGFKKESVVGNRLANYNTMSPRASNSVGGTLQESHSSTTTTTNGDNLLIGEEDKYSALRDLMDDIPNSDQQQEVGTTTINSTTHLPNYVSHVDGNIQHKISLVNDDVLEVVKTETVDKSLDFGEFQSCSSESSHTYTYPSYPSAAVNSHNHHVNDFSSSVRIQQNDLFDVNFAIIRGNNNAKKSSNSEPWLTNEFKGLQTEPSTTTTSTRVMEQNSSLNDGDFGDFVSFSSGGVENVSPSPKIVLKSEIYSKKSTFSSASTSKSKKPSQGVPKISLSRIAKASNILIDSPTTFPKFPKTTSADQQQLSYYQSSNTNHMTSEPSSFDLMTSEGFDIPCGLPPTNFPIQDKAVEFGAPLKTTLIGSSGSDDDDFGDFTSVHQMPMVDSVIRGNNLDLLPFTTSKLNCPAADTKSLASLDLGNYLESSDGRKSSIELDEASPDSSEGLEFEPYMKEELSINRNPDLMQSPIHTDLEFPQPPLPLEEEEDENSMSNFNSEDKYKCFKDEMDSERERYSTEWDRCLTACLHLITYAQSTLNSVSSSEVIREVISNEKGYAYIQNLIEVYLVASRIYLSWKKLGGGVKIEQLFQQITTAWESVTPFLIGSPVMETLNKIDDWKGDYSDGSKVCGVCLSSSTEQNPESLLDYGGKYYHATCANLFINEVDTILPSLYYISML